MFKERAFQVALIVSILSHGAILFNLPNFNTNTLTKSLQKIEITYTYPEFYIPKETVSKFAKPKVVVEDRKSTDTIYIKKKSRISLPEFPKDFLSSTKKFLQVKPKLAKRIEATRKVSLPPTQVTIDNPTYLNYYQKVRETIRKSAFRNFTKMHTGEVYLTFIVLSNGILDKIKLMEKKTDADNYLKNIALRSLTESSPFEPFPKDLKYPQLSFNVIISFEIGD